MGEKTAMSSLPDSLQYTDRYRDELIAAQVKCGRTACDRTHLTHYNQATSKLYCPRCAKAINRHNPGLCIPHQVAPSVDAHALTRHDAQAGIREAR